MSLNVTPNILDQFDNVSYHFRLYMTREKSIVEIPNIAEFKADGAAFAKNKDVFLLAECGSTRVAIDNVSITTIPVTTLRTKTGVATNISFELYEPNSVKFFDYLSLAAKELSIDNFLKCTYYLELTFKGRKADTSLPVESPNDTYTIANKRWVWPIYITEVSTSITASGANYSFSAVPYDEVAYSDTYGVLTKDFVAKNVKKVEDVLEQLAKEYNEWYDVQDIPNKNETHDNDNLQAEHPNSKTKNKIYFDISGIKDKSNLELVSKDELENRANISDNLEYEPSKDEITLTFAKGTSINDVIDITMSITKMAQRIAKEDQEAELAVEKGQEPPSPTYKIKNLYKVFTKSGPIPADKEKPIEPYVYTSPFPFDNSYFSREASINPVTNDYAKALVYYIRDYLEPAATTKANESINPLTHNDIKNNIKKIYHYNGTGLNDQVLSFDINFKFSFFQNIPSAKGLDHQDTNSIAKKTAEKVKNVEKNETEGAQPKAHSSKASNNAVNTLVAANPNTLGQDTTARQDGPPDGSRLYFNALFNQVMNKNESGDLLQAEFTIKGDPFWLATKTYGLNRQKLYRLEYVDSIPNTVNINSSPPGVLVRVFASEQNDIETGVISSTASRINRTITGLYFVTSVTHDFSDGAYTQTLSSYREIRVPADEINKLIDSTL